MLELNPGTLPHLRWSTFCKTAESRQSKLNQTTLPYYLVIKTLEHFPGSLPRFVFKYCPMSSIKSVKLGTKLVHCQKTVFIVNLNKFTASVIPN